MAVPSTPEHMDDLAPYYEGHRRLGAYLVFAGVVATSLGLGMAFAQGVNPLALATGSLPGIFVVLLGIAHRYVGSRWAERRHARRLMAEITA